MDPIKNDALVAVSTGYAAGATTVVLTGGEGTKLPNPSIDGAFNLAWWNSTDYKAPHEDPSRERVRVTARSGDTLTIVRAQEGTSDVAHNTAGKQYMMALVFSKKTYEEFVEAITHNVVANAIESKAFSFQTGKLGQAIRINRFSNTVGDVVSFPRGTQISGNNYTNINTNQGTISFWVKTDWDWNDGGFRRFLSSSSNAFRIEFGPNLDFIANGAAVCSTASQTGNLKNTWYHILVRWDADAVVATSKFAQIFVNGTEVASRASAFTPGAPSDPIYIGSLNQANAAESYFDDLGISDRVATDAEIVALYSAGTGATFDSVMGDSHLKFYAPFDGTVGTAVSGPGLAGGAGNMWTGNLAADGTMEAAGVTSYTQEGSPSTFAKTTTASELLFDTQALKCVGVNAGDGYNQSITVVSGNTYHLEHYKGVVAGTLRLIVDDGAALTYIDTTFSNATYDKFETEIKVTGTTLRVRWLQSGATAATWLVDGLLCVQNKPANGGMEGTYASGIAPSWVTFLEGAHLILSESATAYTGAKSQSIQITSGFGGVLQSISRTVGKFYLFSLAFRKTSASSLSTAIRWSDGSSSWSKYLTATAAATWTKKSFLRKTAAGEHGQIAIGHGNVDTVLVDDAFIFELSSVDLTITPITGRVIVGEALVLLKAGTTGSGSALLGSNFPGATPGAPFTWKTVILEDGSIGYQPVWK